MEGSSPMLVHRNMHPVSADEKTDIIVTPQFYTLKREAVPVKYAYQAKRIAPSLFEGLMEDDKGRDYFVYREGDEWVFIAYSKDEIVDFLTEKGIGQIGRVFFAQQLAPRMEGPIQLSEKEALVNIEGVVTVVPTAGLNDAHFVPPSSRLLPNKGVRFSGGGGGSVLLEDMQAYLLAALFVLFGILWLIEGVRYGKVTDALTAEREAYYVKHPMLQSSYTRENILQKYRTIDRVERKKRDVIRKISGVLSKKITLENFSMDRKGYRATLHASDPSTLKNLKAMLRKAGLKITSVAGSEVSVGGVL